MDIYTPKKRHLPKRTVRDLYNKKHCSPKKEIKGTELTFNNKIYLCTEIVKLLNKHPSIEISCITVKKQNVQDHIRQDANKLYNYMIRLLLCDRMLAIEKVRLIPDKRSIKVESGNSLSDYLQTTLWFECNSKTRIEFTPQESHKNLNLQYIDFIANIVWCYYERQQEIPFSILKNHIINKQLYF